MTTLEKLSGEWELAQARADLVRDVFYAMKHSGRDAALLVLSGIDAICSLGDDEILRLKNIIKENNNG